MAGSQIRLGWRLGPKDFSGSGVGEPQARGVVSLPRSKHQACVEEGPEERSGAWGPE